MADNSKFISLSADTLVEILQDVSPLTLRNICKINIENLQIVCQGLGNYSSFWKQRIKRDFPWVKMPFIGDSWMMTWKYLTECVLFQIDFSYRVIIAPEEPGDYLHYSEDIPDGYINRAKEEIINVIRQNLEETEDSYFDNFVYYFDGNRLNVYSHVKDIETLELLLEEIKEDEFLFGEYYDEESMNELVDANDDYPHLYYEFETIEQNRFSELPQSIITRDDIIGVAIEFANVDEPEIQLLRK
jgi:hypothetical protein